MPWSHHSHSGQFCGHATDTLEEVVRTAIAKGMTTFCMTEHMPREAVDFYPEEESAHTEATLDALYNDFYVEARRLQDAYADKIELFVGFEGEWIRPSSQTLSRRLLEKYPVDVFVGSVHHTLQIPIDYDHAHYHNARAQLGGTDQNIYAQYFDDQLQMLRMMQPPIVGHFDLIRLKSDNPDQSFKQWPEIWTRVIRNLEYVLEYGGVLEINSSSLRKGLAETYPNVEICQSFSKMGGRFTLSDDSHGTGQVGLNYAKVMGCIERAGIKHLQHLCRQAIAETSDQPLKHFKNIAWKQVSVEELREHQFFSG